ncbi:MAG TPA: hypothetical protein VGF13_17715 [Verrucomicrobiae bacterium]|jgi:uncharacterized protein YxjI
MPIVATCPCGQSYTLKDEFAGRLVQCPQCGESIQVPSEDDGAPPVLAGGVFDRDQFLLRQKHFSISEKYYVWDEGGQPILFVERPAHLLRNLGAFLAGALSAIIVGGGLIAVAMATPDNVKPFLIFAGIIGAIFTMLAVSIALSAKRHVNFYSDDTKRELVLQIFQDKKVAIIRATYTVADAAGTAIAMLDKNYIYNLIRKRWYCTNPDGTLICMAKEDSVILSLLRRFIGPLFGILRTNFIFVAPDGETVLGEFNRKFTILDRYAVDLTSDPTRSLDRRIALALGVMLDTGERR